LGGKEKENKGFKTQLATLAAGRISISSLILGSLFKSYEELTEKYEEDLEAGKFVDLESPDSPLLKAATDTYLSWKLLMKAAKTKDAGEYYNLLAAIAKLKPSQDSERNVAAIMEIVGLDALRKGHPLERLFRDDRLLTIGEGTTEIMRLVVFKELTKRGDKSSVVAFEEMLRGMPDEVKGALEKLLKEYRSFPIQDLEEKEAMIMELYYEKNAGQAEKFPLFPDYWDKHYQFLINNVADKGYIPGRIRRRMIDLFAEGQALNLLKESAQESKLAQKLYEIQSPRVLQLAEEFVGQVKNFGGEREVPKREIPKIWKEFEGPIKKTIQDGVTAISEADDMKLAAMLVQHDDDLKKLWDEKFGNRSYQLRADEEEKRGDLEELGKLLIEKFGRSDNERRFRMFFQILGNEGGIGIDVTEYGEDPKDNDHLRNLILELISEKDLSLALMLLEQEKAIAALKTFGNKKQIERLESYREKGRIVAVASENVPQDKVVAKLDAAGDSTVYRLSGKKQFVMNGALADDFIVFAEVPGEGLSAFLVKKEMATKIIMKTNALGLEETPIADIAVTPS